MKNLVFFAQSSAFTSLLLLMFSVILSLSSFHSSPFPLSLSFSLRIFPFLHCSRYFLHAELFEFQIFGWSCLYWNLIVKCWNGFYRFFCVCLCLYASLMSHLLGLHCYHLHCTYFIFQTYAFKIEYFTICSNK